jgi:hypothetical protein
MQLTATGRRLLWKTPTGFGATHCMNCSWGWTRTGKDGAKLTICLLDKEPVLDEMTDCDQYKERPEPPQIGVKPAPVLLNRDQPPTNEPTNSVQPQPSPDEGREQPEPV